MCSKVKLMSHRPGGPGHWLLHAFYHSLCAKHYSFYNKLIKSCTVSHLRANRVVRGFYSCPSIRSRVSAPENCSITCQTNVFFLNLKEVFFHFCSVSVLCSVPVTINNTRTFLATRLPKSTRRVESLI